MLSELEKELGRVRYKQERDLFIMLDKFFDDPSDENLSQMQTLRHDHKESVEALDKARRERRDTEKAAETMSKATAAYVATTAPTLKPLAAAEVDRRLDELRRNAEARIDALTARIEEDKKRDAEAEKPRTFWERMFG